MGTSQVHFANDCGSCGKATVFEVIATHIEVGEEDPPAEYSFARCRDCDGVAVFVREDFGAPGGFDDDSYGRVYPVQKRILRFVTPPVVHASYAEAVKCEQAKAWTACAVMVGRTLEAVANQYAPNSGTLAAAFKSMYESGVISKDIYEWANELRLIRNVGAHAVQKGVARVDAVEALDFAQAILEILYDLRPKFEKMRNRRNVSAQTA